MKIITSLQAQVTQDLHYKKIYICNSSPAHVDSLLRLSKHF